MSPVLSNNFSIRRTLVRGGAGSILVMTSSMLVGFVSVAILARVMGPEDFGVYSYVIVLVGLVSIPLHPGLSTLVLRETARGLAKSDWNMVRGLWRWAFRTTIGVSLVIASITLWIAWALVDAVGVIGFRTFAFGLALLPLLVLIALLGATVRGLGHIVAGLVGEQLLRNGFLVIFVIVVTNLVDSARLSADLAMALNVAASLLALAGGALILRQIQPSEVVNASGHERHTAAWMAAAWPLALVASMQLVNHHADILLLGIFESSREVGVYKVVVSGATLIVFGLQAVNMVVAPHFVRLHALEDERQLQRLVTASSIGALALSTPVAMLFLAFGRPILRLVFGPEYEVGYYPLAILSVGQLANSFFGSVGYLLNMTGHEKDTARGVAIAAGCNILLNLVLIPSYGMNGAAVATAISLLLWNGLLWRSVRLRLGINTIAVSIHGLRMLRTKGKMR